MSDMSFARGSPILVEVEFWKKTPFGDEVLFDPSVATISMWQSGFAQKISDQGLAKVEVGKYYYIAQTSSSWSKGLYHLSIHLEDGSYEDDDVLLNAFVLE